MTDPRIEAAARAIVAHYNPNDEFDSQFSYHKETDFKIAEIAIAAADAAAWRAIESAPPEETILACGGNLSYPTTVSWSGLPGEPWWTDSQEDHHEEIDTPTHWQPLPTPPNAEPKATSETITIPELRNDRPIPGKEGADG